MIKTSLLLFILLICAIKYKTIEGFNNLLEIIIILLREMV